MRDDRVDASLNATWDTGSGMFKMSVAIFVPRLTSVMGGKFHFLAENR